MGKVTNYDLVSYLKFGFTQKPFYSDVYKIEDITFDNAKTVFKQILSDKVYTYDIKKSAFATTGGINSASILSFTNNANTFGFTGKWSNPLSKYFKTNHHLIDFSDIEDDITEITKVVEKPYSPTFGDVFIYKRLKLMKSIGFDIDICEGGPDWLFLSYIFNHPKLYSLSLIRKDYDISKTIKTKSNIKFIILDKKTPYLDLFIEESSTFSENEIKRMGLSYEWEYELKEDNIHHLIKLINDWMVPNRLSSLVFADKLGIKIESPYFKNEEMIDFCLRLPIEYRYCNGIKKFLLKESLDDILPDFVINNKDFNPNLNLYLNMKNQFELLRYKYLNNKNNKIYNYLNYNEVMKFKNFQKIWRLINLSIWLENNDF